MAALYQLTNNSLANNVQQVVRQGGALIPPDPRNADFRAYLEWLAAGNTPDPAPAPSAAAVAQAQYDAAIAAGLTVNWTTSTALDGTYSIAQGDQLNIMAEMVSINTNSAFTNGQQTKNWPNNTMSYHLFTVPQFKAFATQASAYLDALIAASQEAAAGQSTTWPNATVTINL